MYALLRKIISIGCCLSGLLNSAEPVALTVHMHTSATQQRAALQIQDGLPSSYGDAMRFDLSYGGFVELVEPSQNFNWSNKELLRDSLRQAGLQWLLRLRIDGKQLTLDCVSVTGRVVGLKTDGGDDSLSQRRAAHRLADEWHEQIYDRRPICEKRLLYVKNSNSKTQGLGEIWECDYDGYGARKILQDSSGCINPVYLPPRPGKRPEGFCFVSYRLGVPKLFTVLWSQPDDVLRLVAMPGNQFHPSFSPQRNRVAFICDAPGNPDLFVQTFHPPKNVVGKAHQLYPTARGVQATPCFSPDGKRIAFVSDHEGNGRIYCLEIPAQNTPLKELKPLCITRRNGENTAPAWSPDGRYIAYCAKVAGVRQIWIYDFKSGQERQLTSGVHHKENPSWAPDSLHLVFNTADNDSYELYLSNLHSSSAVRLPLGKGFKRFPCWEPIFP